MPDDETLRRSREAAEQWRQGYQRLLERFGDAAPASARSPLEAQRRGWIRARIEASADRWRAQVDSGQRRVVGLNCHRVEEEPAVPIFRVDPEVERIAALRIREQRAARDEARWKRAMAGFERAAERFAGQEIADLGEAELMQAAVEAARADATTGEMMGVLKSALGWGAPHES